MRVAFFAKTAAAALALGALSACATPGFRADVSRFQQMPAPQGQSFAVMPTAGEGQDGLEFQHYAAIVTSEMIRLGYVPANSGETADFRVSLRYGVDDGRERIVRDPGFHDPFWGPGWGYSGFYGRPMIVRTQRGYAWVPGFYDPFLFGPGWSRFNERSYTVYTSHLEMLIQRNGTGEPLFEGQAQAVSRDNDLTRLIPNLAAALFTDFPGNNGETVRITLPPPPRQR